MLSKESTAPLRIKKSHITGLFEFKKRISWQWPTLPGTNVPSTIGAGSLNFRVRDGTGCTPTAENHQEISLHNMSLHPTRPGAFSTHLVSCGCHFCTHHNLPSASRIICFEHFRYLSSPRTPISPYPSKWVKPSSISTAKLTHYCAYTCRLSSR